MDRDAGLGGGKKKPNRLAQAKEHAEAVKKKELASSSKTKKEPTFQEVFIRELDRIVKDWTTAVGEITGCVMSQGDKDICWAICFARLLQAIHNLEHPHNPITFSVEHLVGTLKPDETDDFALSNLTLAFQHISTIGMLKTPTRGVGRAGDKGMMVRENFHLLENVDAEFIRQQLDRFPVALRLVLDYEFTVNKGEIYYLPEKKPITKACIPHALMLIGYGFTKDGRLYFIGQNSYGEGWGCRGYIRFVIEFPCDIICRAD